MLFDPGQGTVVVPEGEGRGGIGRGLVAGLLHEASVERIGYFISIDPKGAQVDQAQRLLVR